MTEEELKVLKALKKDLIIRGETEGETNVVNVSSTIWGKFNDIIDYHEFKKFIK